MATTPAWLAARSGLPADTNAVNHAAQVSQLLGAHGITAVYAGTQIITPAGNVGYGYGGIDWINLGVSDVDQPFAMPGGKTAIGRVTLPLSPAGSGADVTVSLYTDSGGSPGTLIVSTRIPAAWIAQLAAPAGLAAGGPLATAQSNTLRMNDMTTVAWASPVSGTGPALPSVTTSGDYLLQAGGEAGTAYVASVYTAGWSGGAAIGQVLPQPALPGVINSGTLAATGDTLVYAGGTPTLTTLTSAVQAAGWDPSTGQAQAWTAQAALPQAVFSAAGASDGETVYVIGGTITVAGTVSAAVYYATVTNGQITAWNTAPPLPAARANMFAGVVAGWLVAGGGDDASATNHTDVFYASINPDGSLGAWRAGPPLPAATTGQLGCSFAVTPSGILFLGGFGAGTNLVQTLTLTADGPGQWQTQQLNPANFTADGNNLVAAFDRGDGTWQAFTIGPSAGLYSAGVLASVPVISVPLPATGLTPASTYHIVVHQDGGDLNDYTQIALDPGALATAAQTRPNGGGSWTGLTNTYSMLAGVWDQTAGGNVLHTWEDSGARITSLIYGAATGQLLGVCEATVFGDGTMLAGVAQVTYEGAVPAGVVQLA